MEAFKIKNGLSAKRYLGSTTTLSGSTIDLSLGSMFSTTLSSDPAYTFTNPPASGNAQAFSVEVTGGTTTFTQDSFATTLYTGNGSTQTITNGLDLANDGGLIWIKQREASWVHLLQDTTMSRGHRLDTSTNAAIQDNSGYNITSISSTGFGLTDNSSGLYGVNGSAGGAYAGTNAKYVAWSFKKQAKFFDIVTWTGNGAAMTIDHNLGQVPGMIIVKSTSATYNWAVWHREFTGTTDYIRLNLTNAKTDSAGVFGDGSQALTPTSTQFFVGGNNQVSGEVGGTYVAYLFAHDTASDSRIKCGSTTQVSGGTTVDLGWEPQWVLIRAATTSNWFIFDNKRGGSLTLLPNSSNAEGSQGAGAF